MTSTVPVPPKKSHEDLTGGAIATVVQVNTIQQQTSLPTENQTEMETFPVPETEHVGNMNEKFIDNKKNQTQLSNVDYISKG